MSFAPPAAQKLGGVDSRKIATTEEGIPLPWFCGIRRLKANWITPASNRRARDEGRDRGEHWYCDISAAFGYGPATALKGMLYNGKYEAAGFGHGGLPIDRADHPNYYNIPPGKLGLNSETNHWEGCAGRVHWGLDPQPINSGNPAISYPLLFGNYYSNPHYWRVILVEWRQLFMGQNNPSSMPNIEGVFVREPRIPAGWTMDTSIPYWMGSLLVDYANTEKISDDVTVSTKNYVIGAPPVPCLLEFLTDKHTGFGRDPDDFDQSTWEGIASELTANKWKINPLFDKQTTEEAVIAQFLKYFDGYTYYRNGKLALGRHPDAVTILVPENYTEFTDHDLTRSPDLKTTRPDETINEVEVKWIDPTLLQYKEVSKVFDAPHNREARGEPVRESLDLTWKLLEEDVDSYTKQFLGYAAQTRQKGKIYVRANRCKNPNGTPIRVGDVVFLDQSVPQLDHAFRVVGIRQEGYGEIELAIETERGQYPQAYVAPSNPTPDGSLPPVDGMAGVKWMVLPYEITGVTGITVFPLMVRNSGTVSGATLWFADSESAYHPVADYRVSSFGSKGDRTGSDYVDEQYVNEFVVTEAGTSAANGVYTKGADINGHASWVAPNGYYIAWKDITDKWVLYDDTDSELYKNTSEFFTAPIEAVNGDAPVPVVLPDLWVVPGTHDDNESMIKTVTKGESENNYLLMVQGDEIYSLEMVIVDGGGYNFVARRARLGTAMEDHGSSGTLWFVRRDGITYLQHEFFKFGESVTYKIQPRNWAQSAKLEDLSPGTFNLPDAANWLPQISISSPAHDSGSGILTGFQYLGDDIDWDFDVTAPRGQNEDVTVVGYRVGDNQGNIFDQDVHRRWPRPSQASFKTTIEIPILEWYAVTVFASNLYGTSQKTLWAYAFDVPLPDGLTAIGTGFGIKISWNNLNLPGRMYIGVFEKVSGAVVGWHTLDKEESFIALEYWIRNLKEMDYAVWIQAARVVNGKEYRSGWWADTTVPVGKYGFVPSVITSVSSPYAFSWTWDEATAEAEIGEDGFVGYRWKYNSDDEIFRGEVPVGEGIHGTRLGKAGPITLFLWLKDKDGNIGNISQHSLTAIEYPEPVILNVTKPDEYTLRVYYDYSTVKKWVHLWGWPNYTNGFRERQWADYVEAQPAPNNYIDFDCIRSNEHRLSLYYQDEEERWSENPSVLSPSGGVVYATPDAWPVPPQSGATPYVSVFPGTNPYEFILFWNGSGYPSGEWFLVFSYRPKNQPNAKWQYNYADASWGQFNQRTNFAGDVEVWFWIEDRKSRKGIVTQDDTKTIPLHSEPTSGEVTFSNSVSPLGDQTTVEWVIPDSIKPDVQEIQIWDNLDLQVSGEPDQLIDRVQPEKATYNFPQDHFNGVAAGENITIAVRYVRDNGEKSAFEVISFSRPAGAGVTTHYAS